MEGFQTQLLPGDRPWLQIGDESDGGQLRGRAHVVGLDPCLAAWRCRARVIARDGLHAPKGNPAYRFRRQKIRRVHSVATIRRSSKYVYETGTTTSVRIVAVVMPPTSVLPKGP